MGFGDAVGPFVGLAKEHFRLSNLLAQCIPLVVLRCSASCPRPRLEDGKWADGFDPTATGTTKRWGDFTESNSWQGTWAAQHEPEAYIELLGSPQGIRTEAG
jgi:hypothetical protein